MLESSNDLINIERASKWATEYLGKRVTISNISYLIQYGRIRKYGNNGNVFVSQSELERYYRQSKTKREESWREQLGEDLNWALSFEQYKEAETTKHVHRLHPYKGKFIPQLVEYFLDSHTDKNKREVFFKPNDIVLDPFAGSGTTLVQASELNMHAVGIDISEFNAMIANCKIDDYDIESIESEINRINATLTPFFSKSKNQIFEEELLGALHDFNAKYFPVPEYKYRLRNGEIDEREYGLIKEKEFLPIYYNLINKYNIDLQQKSINSFLDKWYLMPVRREFDTILNEINKIRNEKNRKLLMVILSRTIRSCRATKHSDLATIYEPILETYYCTKHGKICKPIFSIRKWWDFYSKDTLKRINQFKKLKTNTYQYCIKGDSRNVEIITELAKANIKFSELISKKKISGIFSSPPYVGLIDYHEQHAYAYDLFGFTRQDSLEIGALSRGQGKEAKDCYVDGISEVLINTKIYMIEDYNVFLVANDKYDLYPLIAEKSGMRIVDRYKRPVLNRTEKDRNAYSEIIFRLKEEK